jgi:hypothetical protein
MLGLLNVDSTTYKTKLDIFNSCDFNANTTNIAKIKIKLEKHEKF